MKKDVQLYILLILSIFCIPAAYLFVAAVFVVQINRGNYNSLKKIKNNKMLIIVLTYIFIGVAFSDYLLISSLYGLMILICLYTVSITYESMDYIDIYTIKRILYIVSIIVFIIGIVQFLSPQFVIPKKWVDGVEYQLNKRIYSTFFNPNIFGFYINIVLIIASINMKSDDRLGAAVFIVGVLCLF